MMCAVRATLGEGNRVTGKPRTENEGENSLPILGSRFPGFPVARYQAKPALGWGSGASLLARSSAFAVSDQVFQDGLFGGEAEAAFEAVADDLEFCGAPIAIGTLPRAIEEFTIGADHQSLSATLRTRQAFVV